MAHQPVGRGAIPELRLTSTPIMYWLPLDRGDDPKRFLQRDPRDFVRDDVPRARREEAAEILKGSEWELGWNGVAKCRICEVILGSMDHFAHGFMWPEQAEHYVLEHDVWIPELDDLLAAARAKSTPS